MTVEIRRHATFMGVVAVAATLVMLGFVWRTIDSGGVWSGLIAVVLACIAGLHAFQWWDARTPMMIADERGLRVRLGRGWSGFLWQDVERLEIDEPRRLGDGHVAVFADSVEGRIAESDAWARVNAAANRLLFDAPLVVPFGLTTHVSSDDLAESLAELADDRCEIVLLDADAPVDEPTITIFEQPAADEPVLMSIGDPEVAERDSADDEDETDAPTHNTSLVFADLDRSTTRSHWSAAETEPVADGLETLPDEDADTDARVPAGVGAHAGPDAPADADEDAAGEEELSEDAEPSADDVPVAAREGHDDAAGRRSLRLPRWGRGLRRQPPQPAEREVAASASWSYSEGPAGGLTVDGVSALPSASARRTDVTMPVGDGPVTDGNLALSQQPVDEQATEPLPEVRELRRRTEDENEARPAAADAPAEGQGNIGLIIDATTDISERAMSRAWPSDAAPGAEQVDEPGPSEQHRAPRVAEHEVVIGNFLRRGREDLGLSVDDLADRTRIRPHVIESLEVDDFSPCGGDFYVRGHLRTLSRVLNLDADELVRRYDNVYSAPEVNARQVFAAERASKLAGAGGRSRRDGAPRWLGLAIVVLLLVLVWSLAKYVADASVNDSADADAPASGSPGVADTSGVPPELTATVSAKKKPSTVVVRSRYGEELFRGRLRPGQSEQVVGAAPLRVTAEHGRRVTVTYAGEKSKVGKDGRMVLTAPAGQQSGR